MLREIRHRRQRSLAGFLGLTLLLVFALRGFLVAAPSAALIEARANGQSAICIGSAIITISEDGEAQHIIVDSCDDGRIGGEALLPTTALAARRAIFAPAPWRRAAAQAPRRAVLGAHPARAPPFA